MVTKDFSEIKQMAIFSKKDVDTEKIVFCGSEYIKSVLTIIKMNSGKSPKSFFKVPVAVKRRLV